MISSTTSIIKLCKFKDDEFNLGIPTSLPWPLLGDLADIYLEPENKKVIGK